jgi:hypothetical protein
MNIQILQDGKGNSLGVFIPIDDWNLMKKEYPNIESIKSDIPQWEKDLIDNRLSVISQNPDRLKSGDKLIKELRRDI